MWLHRATERNASNGSTIFEYFWIFVTFCPDVPSTRRSSILHSYGFVTHLNAPHGALDGNMQWCIGCCGSMKLDGSNSPDIKSTVTDFVHSAISSSTALTAFSVRTDSGCRIDIVFWRTSINVRTELPATIMRTMFDASKSALVSMPPKLPYIHCSNKSRDSEKSWFDDWSRPEISTSNGDEDRTFNGFCGPHS